MTHPRQPDPQQIRYAWPLNGALAAGATVAQSGSGSVKIPLLGATRFRLRFKTDRAGTLSAAFLRPDGVTPYEQNNPSNVAVSVDTETKMDVDPLFGEGWLEVTYTEGGVGIATIAVADAMWGY